MNRIKEDKLNNKEIIYLNIIKIFACFMVIINHTNGFILEYNSFANTTFYCVTFSLCKVGVALFLMITGSLLLNKIYSFKKVLKCIFRVGVPVLSLSFLFYIKSVGINNINLFEFFYKLLLEPYIVSYWYIYALIGVYLTLPFIQKMVKNFTNKDYIIFISIFLIVPTTISFFQNCFGNIINSDFQVAFFPIIISIIVSGYFLSKVHLSKKLLIGSTFIFITSYIIMFLSMYLPYLNMGEISYRFDSWNSFPVILMSLSLFYIFRHLFENIKYHKRTKNIITTLASTTFGIYLI